MGGMTLPSLPALICTPRFSEAAILTVLGLQFHRAFRWIGHTWQESTYESWGILPVLLLGAALFKLPPLRPAPRLRYLAYALGCAFVDAITAPLELNVLSALLGVTALHLGLLAFRRFRGSWIAQRQLWLGMLCLPAVYWLNVTVGYQLQSLASTVAASMLRAYGLMVDARGTMLQLPGLTLAVDTACSGLKILFSGLLFGLVAAPALRPSPVRTLLFWGLLLAQLLFANSVRVTCLAMATLFVGQAPGEGLHQVLGLVVFVLVCVICLFYLRLTAAWGQPARTMDSAVRTAASTASIVPGDESEKSLSIQSTPGLPSRAICLVMILLGLCAGLRQVQGRGPDPRTRTVESRPMLPARIGPVLGEAAPLGASEQLLARRPGVAVERRRFGSTLAVLLTSQGLKEHHPPQVCLKAGGFEVMEQQTEHNPAGCVNHLTVRREGRPSHFFYTHLSASSHGALFAPGRCGFWPQALAAAWERLRGGEGTWSTVQVMDPDPDRARNVLDRIVRSDSSTNTDITIIKYKNDKHHKHLENQIQLKTEKILMTVRDATPAGPT